MKKYQQAVFESFPETAENFAMLDGLSTGCQTAGFDAEPWIDWLGTGSITPLDDFQSSFTIFRIIALDSCDVPMPMLTMSFEMSSFD